MCLNCKSEEGCVFGEKCRFRHVEDYLKPNKTSKKGGAKGSVVILEESTQLGCVSQDSHPRKPIIRELGKWGSKHTVFQGHLAPNQKIGKERDHREVISQSVHFMSVVLARRNSRTVHLRIPCTQKDVRPQSSTGFVEKKGYTSSRVRTKLRLMLLLKSKVRRAKKI